MWLYRPRKSCKVFNGLILVPPTSSPVSHVVVPDGTAPTTLSSLQGVLAGCWVLGYSCEYSRPWPNLPTTSPKHTCLLRAVLSKSKVAHGPIDSTSRFSKHYLSSSILRVSFTGFLFSLYAFVVKAKL